MVDKEASPVGDVNLPFGELMIEALKRLGVRHFVVSPGSRSTPLAVAAAALGKEYYTVCLDERSAAFMALGRVKATRSPVALICTSGTAGAHYYPAVIEARESALPLIVMTADRPPELHHCHAGQTIDQGKLYGGHTLLSIELPIPENDRLLMRQVRELCRRAVEQANGTPGGPVHLNCPFREPFFPQHEGNAHVSGMDLLEGLKPVQSPQTRLSGDVSLPERVLILAGPRPWKDPGEEVQAVLDLSRKTGWPILADGVSPLRYGKSADDCVISGYDWIVRDPNVWEALKPDVVVLWGEPPTSKFLRKRLQGLDLPGYQIGSGKSGMNPFHGKIIHLGGSVSEFMDKVSAFDGAYGQQWLEQDRKAGDSQDRCFAEEHDLFEGDVHRLLGKVLPDGAQVFYTSSLAVRGAEWFMPARAEPLVPYSQRGANGIDGTLSIARGIAAGSQEPAYLVSGDLAFLHDSNGLLGSTKQTPGVFVILLNNEGGGIFELLPAARHASAFEEVFCTPQNVDFASLIAAHGGIHMHCRQLHQLEEMLAGWDGTGLLVAEVSIDRKTSADLHRKFLSNRNQ